MATDLEIAQAAKIQPIGNIAKAACLKEESLSPYGRYIAKVDPAYYRELPRRLGYFRRRRSVDEEG